MDRRDSYDLRAIADEAASAVEQLQALANAANGLLAMYKARGVPERREADIVLALMPLIVTAGDRP